MVNLSDDDVTNDNDDRQCDRNVSPSTSFVAGQSKRYQNQHKVKRCTHIYIYMTHEQV